MPDLSAPSPIRLLCLPLQPLQQVQQRRAISSFHTIRLGERERIPAAENPVQNNLWRSPRYLALEEATLFAGTATGRRPG
jgi:hypothetical protein